MKFRTIAIILIIILLGVIIYFGIKNNNTGIEILTKNNVEDLNTNLLQIQAKVKVIKEQSVVKDDATILKGEKIKASINEEVISLLNQMKENGVISEEEENFDKYYVWDKALLEELNLALNLQDNDKIIINYETLEIILPDGVQLVKDSERIYKFSEFNIM